MIDKDGASQPEFEHRRRTGASLLEAHTARTVHAPDNPRRPAPAASNGADASQVGEIDHNTVVIRVKADCVKDAPIGQIGQVGGRHLPIATAPAAGQPTQQIATPRPPTDSSTDRPAEPNADRQDLAPDLETVTSNRAS